VKPQHKTFWIGYSVNFVLGSRCSTWNTERTALGKAKKDQEQDLAQFQALCAEHSISIAPNEVYRLGKYRDLLVSWNQRVRLVSRADGPRFLSRHVFESLLFLRSLQPDDTRLADIGTGGGLPGIPISIGRQNVRVTLIESARMKTLFLKDAVASLSLPNVEVIHDRVENVWANRSGVFDIVTARAVARLDHLWELAEPLLKPQGSLISLKGPGEAEDDLGPLGIEFKETLIDAGDRAVAIVSVQKS
jgi:16S rRNA (guanine527-N7)-methyltransferase